MQKFDNFIDGAYVTPASGNYIDNFAPATGKVYSQVAASCHEDIDHAVDAAREAFKAWSITPAAERSQILNRIADLIEENSDQLAEAESQDQGKPFWPAKSVDIPRARDNFRFFASAILHHTSESSSMDQAINYTLRQPIGVAGLISPWNLPLYLLTWKIAPALATGNTAVCKPSELTSRTAMMLGEIFNEAGLPRGVCNIVLGLGIDAGRALVAHPEVPIISFTGGTQTAEAIIKDAAPHFKKLSLELGGKNPNIIFADCDFEKCLETTIRSSFLNQGEICLCGSRIYVEESLYEQFVKEFTARVSDLKVGDPADEKNFMGALVSKEHLIKVCGYIEEAKKLGGKIETGGIAPELSDEFQDGYFLRPTIITGLDNECSVMQEEIFGPVVTISSFKTEEEVLSKANGVKYGLSASLWTKDMSRTQRITAGLKVGQVWVNTWLKRDLRVPFGGVKHSGVGREGGKYSLDFFTEPKNVCINY